VSRIIGITAEKIKGTQQGKKRKSGQIRSRIADLSGQYRIQSALCKSKALSEKALAAFCKRGLCL
jgi:hypothetical protein